jgi:hypothetical protein
MQPPRGPEHVARDSPQAATQCPQDRQRAQAAREDLIEFGRLEHRQRASEAVFRHAECERQKFDSFAPIGSTVSELLVKLRAGRELYFTTRNLYEEVIRYELKEGPQAQVRLGNLHEAYAAKLRAVTPPPGLQQGEERTAFTTELATLIKELEDQARETYLAVLKTHDKGAFQNSVAPWLQSACHSLQKYDQNSAQSLPACQTKAQ